MKRLESEQLLTEYKQKRFNLQKREVNSKENDYFWTEQELARIKRNFQTKITQMNIRIRSKVFNDTDNVNELKLKTEQLCNMH